MSGAEFNLSEKEKQRAESIVTKVTEAHKTDAAILSFDELNMLITTDEKALIERLLAVNPADYGFKGPFLGLEDVPDDIVECDQNGDKIPAGLDSVTAKYLPLPVYEAFLVMNQAIKSNIGKRLIITSGYRSPAYQAVTFLYYLKKHNFNFGETARVVAIPGYSEHGSPAHQALDLMTEEGISDDNRSEEYVNTPEFAWLSQNAGRFGFVMSYPKDNQWGVIFEPWHWRYEA